jgi:hypothetical protein
LPGFESNQKINQLCHAAAYESVVSAAEGSRITNKRFIVFATKGCAGGRYVWSSSLSPNASQNVAVFGDCSTGSKYRLGIDLSLSTIPYPNLYVSYLTIFLNYQINNNEY